MPSTLTCRVEGGVAQVRLNRPDKLNALTLDTLQDLVATARELSGDRTLRGVVIAGEGESFCAGLDFATVLKNPPRVARSFVPNPLRGTNLFQEACWAWRRGPVPVVAAVHGHCYGGGLQIALAADLRMTTPDAQWSVLEAKWGLVPDMSGTEFLGRVRDLYPDTIRMVLSGYTDVTTITEAINRGAIYRFLTKPWNDEELREHIHAAFRAYERRASGEAAY